MEKKELTWGVKMKGEWVALGLVGGDWPINSGGSGGRVPEEASSCSSSSDDDEGVVPLLFALTFPILEEERGGESH